METAILLFMIALFGTMGTFLSIEAKRRRLLQSAQEQDEKPEQGFTLTEGN